MLSAINSARLSTAQIHLHAITVREDAVSYQFSSTLYTQIHLQAITARGDGISYKFSLTF
jgi:hypothetical protein